ncbi:GntR family transcriptional regulator [Rhodococcus sp. 15-725-2-2b]|uniref:GntR family transcriptional regulator n=1 Tax=Nocardiaceae TaxID=85025 RepID=UPI00050C082B|nr:MULTISPECIES: GntR family transcriptional regulator [Rhodococcus]OZC70047.1 GntR family transcriptional regulator [Rhodococcus sp. 06-469-3-2]OZD40408.1 GntR family transcriptional regulator [Rhodococcus sp. 06-1477-1A]OZD85795.1 GntR family transcriptional regulator [Rhodococcus sp. 05-339-2]OZE02548.1 GntR family transcriptional regulator [Rhodococcus sp. 05-2255-3C]OZE11385.1 GntR family transcriptional regulator [Rhodococcus sp. 05-2255-3B1]
MSELSDKILDLLVSGLYSPGEKLNEAELAGRLGVSRTPVREALLTLATTGVVTVEKNKGARVTEFTRETVEAIYSSRSLLEPHAAKLATGHFSVEELAELRRTAQRMHDIVVEAEDLPEIARLNNAFHTAVLSKCPNARMAEMAIALLKPLVAARTFRKYSAKEISRSAAHHLEIVDALECEDAEWVEAIMRAHIRAGCHSATAED